MLKLLSNNGRHLLSTLCHAVFYVLIHLMLARIIWEKFLLSPFLQIMKSKKKLAPKTQWWIRTLTCPRLCFLLCQDLFQIFFFFLLRTTKRNSFCIISYYKNNIHKYLNWKDSKIICLTTCNALRYCLVCSLSLLKIAGQSSGNWVHS